MVRTQVKQTSDEKKDSKKKISGSSKKKADTGSWPCKMDGCKKVFAREADLKRHQRTTKMHSIPGFQCPQCDATFTRTDALRRHQKSRHNGVIIEPAEPDKDKHSGEGGSSGSQSPSPTGSPARSQGEGSINSSPSAGQPSTSTRASSYYRPHTMQDGYYSAYAASPRPPPGMIMETQYPPPPIGLPTSATRGSWQPTPAPPWPGPDGQPMAPPPPGMYISASYYPSPYYRHPGVPIPQHIPQINPELLSQSNGHSNGIGPPESSIRNSAGTPTSRIDGRHRGDSSASASGSSSVAPTDSSRTSTPQGSGTDDGSDASTLMAAAALHAVLAFQKEQEAREAQGQSASMRSTHPLGIARVDRPSNAEPPTQTEVVIDPALEADRDTDRHVPTETSEPEDASGQMEQFVSEDGTPMLNPAELLTQESLASPPP